MTLHITTLLDAIPSGWREIPQYLATGRADDWTTGLSVLADPGSAWFDRDELVAAADAAVDAGAWFLPAVGRSLLARGYDVRLLAAGAGIGFGRAARGGMSAIPMARLNEFLAIHPDLAVLHKLGISAVFAPADHLRVMEASLPASQFDVLCYAVAGLLLSSEHTLGCARILASAMEAGMPSVVTPSLSLLGKLPETSLFGQSADGMRQLRGNLDQSIAVMNARFPQALMAHQFDRMIGHVAKTSNNALIHQSIFGLLCEHRDLARAAMSTPGGEGVSVLASQCPDRLLFEMACAGFPLSLTYADLLRLAISHHQYTAFAIRPRVIDAFKKMLAGVTPIGPFTVPRNLLAQVAELERSSVHELHLQGMDVNEHAASDLGELPEHLNSLVKKTSNTEAVIAAVRATPEAVGAACTTLARLRGALSVRADWPDIVPHLPPAMQARALDITIGAAP